MLGSNDDIAFEETQRNPSNLWDRLKKIQKLDPVSFCLTIDRNLQEDDEWHENGETLSGRSLARGKGGGGGRLKAAAATSVSCVHQPMGSAQHQPMGSALELKLMYVVGRAEACVC